ncbi:ATP-dependent helicase/deoxyribonuclease subunit B [Kroppenstedtia guangzhouensis]|uniref:ATP-dependent helicase/deoxyribonuclease subunit B n=1 Tax=Kroppenstedtia guangzhouensis TaxID=1274356 RepID=A0ABQ1G792_9BACL|nr:PD-(D/E)XK nuclease family protein [Kroppenstedtia guangzhouensis]GGA38156.1 ATP-dependent helicase/deoxyribonuclease subunit B [Kroppenstedtia guangzhouensis]
MAGEVVLHSVSRAIRGVGLTHLPLGRGGTVCLVPGSATVRDYRRLFYKHQIPEKQVTVQSFDSFVMGLMPGKSARLMTPVEQELLVQQAVSRVIEEGGFSYFRRMAERPGWLKLMEVSIGELKRAGVRPPRLRRLWGDASEEKYREMTRVYEVYQELLREFGLLDHEEPFLIAMERVRKGECQLPERVVAEHFVDLSHLQEQLLVQLVSAGVPVSLHLGWDARRSRLFSETRRLVDRLSQRGFHIRKVFSPAPDTGKTGALLQLEEEAFHPSPETVKGEGAVEVLSAPGEAHEVEVVVAAVKQWLLQSGAALSDVALVTNRPEEYHPLLFTSLKKAGIPFDRPEEIPLSQHPLLGLVRSALALRMGKEELRLELVDHPCLPWIRVEGEGRIWREILRQIGRPQNRVDLRQGLTGIHPEHFGCTEESLARLQSFYQWLEEIPTEQTWRGWVEWMTDWIRPLDPRPRARQVIGNPEGMELWAVEVKAWKSLCSIADEWAAVFARSGGLGEEGCNLATFAAVLEQAARGKKVVKRPARRGGIRLLEPNRIRGDRYRAVFVLGCTEGKWPRFFREDWLIPDQERLRLREEGLSLPLAEELREHQLLPFFFCAVAATEKLVFSYSSASPEGKGQLASPYLQELLQVFGKEGVQKRKRSIGDRLPLLWEDCTFLLQGAERAVASLAAGGSKSDVLAERVLHRLREDSPSWFDTFSARVRAEGKRGSEGFTVFDGVIPSSSLPADLGVKLRDGVWSASVLNEVARCRFHYFAGRILGAQSPDVQDEALSPLERGNLMHRILCRFWDRYREQPPMSSSAESAREHLIAVTESVFSEFVREKGKTRPPALLGVERKRLERLLLSILDHDLEWRKNVDGEIRPRFLELSFGMDKNSTLVDRREMDPSSREETAELSLGNGRFLRLRGKVDRVDQDEEGYYMVYDYKSGSAPGLKEVLQGIHLQLPLYLWVLQEAFGMDPAKAVGAAYFTPGTRKGKSPGDHRNRGIWRKEEARRAGIGSRVKGVLEEGAWEEVLGRIRAGLAKRLELLEQGDFAVDPAGGTCPDHCPHRSVCRVDEQRLVWKSEAGRELT